MRSVSDLLRSPVLEQYEAVFASKDIGRDVLPEWTDADLHSLGISLGNRRWLRSSALPRVSLTRPDQHTRVCLCARLSESWQLSAPHPHQHLRFVAKLRSASGPSEC